MSGAAPSHPYDHARAMVAEEFAAFEERLEEVVARQAEYLTDTERAFYRRGKRLRPLLLLLSARVAERGGRKPLPDKAVAAAVSLELAHVGSLIHDDIVDRAPTRRGLPTVSASRGYELALVIGDLQWVEATRTMAAFMETPADIELMRQFLDTGEQTCRGQLDEMLGASRRDGDELVRRYYRTIDRKTGRLVSFACEGGARVMEGTPAVVGGLRRFGSWLGRAFQVMDDVLDVVRPAHAAGKEPLTDLLQGRLSLPLVYTLQALPPGHFLQRLRTGEALDEEELREAARLVRFGDGWIRAFSDARAIVARAHAELSFLPEGPYRQALWDLSAHLVNQGFLDPHGTAPGPAPLPTPTR